MDNQRRILIADGSEEFGLKLKEAIECVPEWKVAAVAGDGMEAVELLNVIKPDVIVLDLMLPKVDGIAVLRQAAALNPVPVCVVLTAFLTEYAATTAAGLGVRYFMAKPCKCDAVTERLGEILRAETQSKRQQMRRDDVNIEAMVTS